MVMCMWCVCDVYVMCMRCVCDVYVMVMCMWCVCDVYVMCMWCVCDVYVMCMWYVCDVWGVRWGMKRASTHWVGKIKVSDFWIKFRCQMGFFKTDRCKWLYDSTLKEVASFSFRYPLFLHFGSDFFFFFLCDVFIDVPSKWREDHNKSNSSTPTASPLPHASLNCVIHAIIKEQYSQTVHFWEKNHEYQSNSHLYREVKRYDLWSNDFEMALTSHNWKKKGREKRKKKWREKRKKKWREKEGRPKWVFWVIDR